MARLAALAARVRTWWTSAPEEPLSRLDRWDRLGGWDGK